mmetsp:Transcript_35065/g.73635  ORF Transcript_35065/g.73635 Transcript_35065/m.73635 type:complete len:185 (+) Transcript_35065:1314-1868(+)
MLTRLIVRTPALCLAKDRSFPSAAPMSAAKTIRTISRYSVAADTGQVMTATDAGAAAATDATAAGAAAVCIVAVAAIARAGQSIAAVNTSDKKGGSLRRNLRANLAPRRPRIFGFSPCAPSSPLSSLLGFRANKERQFVFVLATAVDDGIVRCVALRNPFNEKSDAREDGAVDSMAVVVADPLP